MTQANDDSDAAAKLRASVGGGGSADDTASDLSSVVVQLREQVATLQESHIAVSHSHSELIANLTQQIAKLEDGMSTSAHRSKPKAK
jgi:hypothetical protein